MKHCAFQIGEEVQMTPDAIKLKLHRHGRKYPSSTGRVVMYNSQAGLITVIRDGDRENRLYAEKFWCKKVESAQQQA